MESSKVSLRPEKFTGKDWSFWKEQMQAVFMLEGLWGIVDGSVTHLQKKALQLNDLNGNAKITEHWLC